MHSAYLSSLRWDCWMVVSLLRDVVSQPAKFFVGGEKRVFIQKGWAKAQTFSLWLFEKYSKFASNDYVD